MKKRILLGKVSKILALALIVQSLCFLPGISARAEEGDPLDLGAMTFDLRNGDVYIKVGEKYSGAELQAMFYAYDDTGLAVDRKEAQIFGIKTDVDIDGDGEPDYALDLDNDGTGDVGEGSALYVNDDVYYVYKRFPTCSCKGTVTFYISDNARNAFRSYESRYFSSLIFIFPENSGTEGNANQAKAPTVENAAPSHSVGETVASSGASFTITSVEEGKQAVTYVKPDSKDAKNTIIPDAVNIDGTDYKVTEIAPGAFKNNKKLKKTTIGKNIEKIGKGAYQGCVNLKNIKIKSTLLTKKSVGSGAFKKIHPSAKCKVPKKVLKAYKKFLPKKGLNGKGQKITK